MSNRTKNIIYTVVLLVAVFAVMLYRKYQVTPMVIIQGETMGTTYHISYFDKEKRNFKNTIDSVLVVFNQSLNTYLPHSEITDFNTGGSPKKFELPYFYPVLSKSGEIVSATSGAFDPTVMPLVNAWGFGPGKQADPDSAQIDSIKSFIGFEKIQFNKDSLWKTDPRVQLDFSAIAKGYGVDVVCEILRANGIENMFVEIGGEVRTLGENLQSGKPWQIGILDPNSTIDNQFFTAYASLTDKAMATSGNYFNFREVNGQKVSHTIDPISGYPVQRNILSATVIADDCMTADAWATAFMVMGVEKAKESLARQTQLGALLIYSNADGTFETYVSDNLSDIVSLH